MGTKEVIVYGQFSDNLLIVSLENGYEAAARLIVEMNLDWGMYGEDEELAKQALANNECYKFIKSRQPYEYEDFHVYSLYEAAP
jgi:hypothetical protein